MSIKWKGSNFSASKQLTTFADDALIGLGTVAVKEFFAEMNKEDIGLILSENKTKYLLTLEKKSIAYVSDRTITMSITLKSKSNIS